MHPNIRCFAVFLTLIGLCISGLAPISLRDESESLSEKAMNFTSDAETLSLKDNVARGLIRARVSYPNAQLLRVSVQPLKQFPPADPKWLIGALKLTLFDEATRTFLREPANEHIGKWGEWADPHSVPRVEEKLSFVQWEQLNLDVEEAAARCIGAGFGGPWLKVQIEWPASKAEPEFQFWQSRHRIGRTTYPRYVIVTAMTGEVAAVWDDDASSAAANITFS